MHSADEEVLQGPFERDHELGTDGVIREDFGEVEKDVCVVTVCEGDIEADGRETAKGGILAEGVGEHDLVAATAKFDR